MAYLKVILVILTILVTHILTSPVLAAEPSEWIIEPVILVPKQFHTYVDGPEFNLAHKKQLILDALKDVQDFYRERLVDNQGGNHTFRYKPEVQVVKVNSELKFSTKFEDIPVDIQGKPLMGSCPRESFTQLGGKIKYGEDSEFLKPVKGKSYMIFIVGGKFNVACGYYSIDAKGELTNVMPNTYFSMWHLKCLEGSLECKYQISRDRPYMAHELGHVFGVASTVGWAFGHTCTRYNTRFCQDKKDGVQRTIDRTPLAEPNYGEIMNYAPSDFRKITPFNKYFFANTEFNPFVWQMLRSPFIRQNGTIEAPPIQPEPNNDPTPNDPTDGIQKIFTFDTITTGDYFTIEGKGFGLTKGKVEILPVIDGRMNDENKLTQADYEIGRWSGSWTNETIDIKFLKFVDEITTYGVIVSPANSTGFWTSDITNKAHLFKVRPFEAYKHRIFKISINTSCTTPHWIRVFKPRIGADPEREELSLSYQITNGTKTIEFPMEEAEGGGYGEGIYIFQPEPMKDLNGDFQWVKPYHELLLDTTTSDLIREYKYNYPDGVCTNNNTGGSDNKQVSSIRVGNRTLLSADVAGMNISLRDFGGTEGQAKVITVPVIYTYTDGSTEQKAITFNYNGGSSGGTACVNEQWREVSGQFTCTGCGQAKRKEKKYCNGVATTETRTRSYEQRESDCNSAQYCTKSCNKGTPYQLFDGRKYDCSDGGGEKCSGGFYDMNNICSFGARCEKLFCNCDYRENTDNTDNCDDGKVRVRVCKGGDPRHTTETGSDTDDGCGYRQEVPPACRLTNECNTP